MSKYPSIEKSAKKCGATVLYCKKVTTLLLSGSSKNTSKNKKKIKSQSIKKILLITDCFIEQYDIDNIEEPEKKAFWFDLLKVNVNTENNYFSLEFAYPEPTEVDIKNGVDPQNYIFQLTNKDGDLLSFYKIIIELIQRILTEQEMKDLVFFDDEELYGDDEYFEKFNFTPRGAFARFLILSMKKKNEFLSQNVKEAVAEYILMKYNNINIKNEFCIENCLDIFLSILKTLPYVESVSIPPFNKFLQVDSLNILANFLKKASNIQHIEVHGPCLKSHFHDLCRTIGNMGVIDNDNKGKRKSQCKLTGITFDGLELSTEQVASIKTAAISGRLLSLGINNIKPPANSKTPENDTVIDYIVDTLISPHLTMSLRILSLDGNQDIDIQKLFENSGSIEKVSLKNCGLEITHVFEALASIQTSIDSIDLSYNNCSNSDIDKAIMSLSRPLLRIDVNNVTWSDDCLVNFLRGIVQLYEISQNEDEESENENEYDEDEKGSNLKDTFLNSEENVNSGLNSYLVTLSISYINTSKSEWQNVRTFFEDNHKKVSIEQFSYNGNKISSHFIIFLRSMKKLRRLFMNNCPNFSQFSSTLATNFIAKSATLTELYIEKADSSSFPEDSSFSTFFKKCCDSTSLRLINAKMCNIGVDGLTSLSNLILKCRSGNLNQVAFDGTGVDSFEDIKEFVSTCQEYVSSLNKQKGRKKSSSSRHRNKNKKRLYIELPSYDLRLLKVPESKIEMIKGDIADLARTPDEKDQLWVSPYEFYIMQKNDEFPRFFHPIVAEKLHRKLSRSLEYEKSLRKSEKSRNSSYSKRSNSSRIKNDYDDENNTNRKSNKLAKSTRNNYGRSYRNNDGFDNDNGGFDNDRYSPKKKGFLYVGKDDVSDSDEDKRIRNRNVQINGKSKYDDDEDEFDLQENRGRNGEGKKRSGFKFNDWSFPIDSLEKADEINDNLVIRLEDKFSLRQLITDVSNKNDDNRF